MGRGPTGLCVLNAYISSFQNVQFGKQGKEKAPGIFFTLTNPTSYTQGSVTLTF